MTNEEIKNKAKETSGGNYYYEQGFIYGFELGEENGRKEKQTIIDKQTVEIESRDVYLTEKENIIIRQQIEIQELKAHCKAVDKVNEYMKCCENCKHDFECDGIELCDKWEMA